MNPLKETEEMTVYDWLLFCVTVVGITLIGVAICYDLTHSSTISDSPNIRFCSPQYCMDLQVMDLHDTKVYAAYNNLVNAVCEGENNGCTSNK